jgi:hypothetical protein
MSPVAALGQGFRVVAIIPLLVLLMAPAGVPAAAAADQPPPGAKEKRSAVGKCLSPAGTLFGREASSNAWHGIPQQAGVFTTDLLMALPGDRATIHLKDGAVRLTLWGNLPEFSAASVLESAVTLHANPAADVDLTLERGRVVLARDKGKEPIKVRLHFHGHTWELVLDEVETEVALELYGHWPPGAPFRLKAEPADSPVAALMVFVLKGQADLKRTTTQNSLRAPPGPAFFQWNSVSGSDVGPKRRDKVPPWAEKGPRNTPEAQAFQTAVERQRRQLGDMVPAAALAKSLDQPDSASRQLAVYSLAALDETASAVAALENSHRDVRDAAVLALQHWIGRGPGQDGKLYQLLTGRDQYSPQHAETLLHLLHDFSRDDLDRPETYETLIAYLRHSKPAIRTLAAGYLYRLAPAGKTIAYNPLGSEDQRDKAYKEWKALIPFGKLAPKAKP